MKIINTSKPYFRDRRALEVKDLENKTCINRNNHEKMPVNLQRTCLLKPEEVVKYRAPHRRGRQPEEEKAPTKQNYISSFSSFRHLPIEIRICIYELCFTPDLMPKIHCVDERISDRAQKGSRFVSNQPMSPFLHVCRESRAYYLFMSKASFAFGTYVNFSLDTIYIPDLAFREQQFPRFLVCPSAKKIERLALRKDFYCNLPGREIMWDNYLDMLCALPQWRELVFVFNDEWTRTEVWEERSLSFRDLSAREKRYGPGACERGFARQWAAILNRISSHIGLGQIRYRFVVPANSCGTRRKFIE